MERGAELILKVEQFWLKTRPKIGDRSEIPKCMEVTLALLTGLGNHSI